MAGTEERETYWSPSRNYEISCKVGKVDLTNDLVQMNIVSGVEIPYRTYVLDFFLDANDIILEKIYGQKPIEIKIKVFGSSENIPHEIIETNLMALGTKYDLLMKDTQPQIPDKIRSSIRIRAIPVEGYQTMTTFVNGVYLGTDLHTIISDLVKQAGGDLVYDEVNRNVTQIDQIIVPPSPLYKALQYLNRTFGLFDGLAGIYSSSIKTKRKSNSAIKSKLKTTVYIKNLTNAKTFANTVITQLSSTANQEDLLNTFDGKNFYTYNPVETEYSGNTIFSLYGITMKHVVKPRDTLYRTIELDVSDFASDYGITTNKNQLFHDRENQEQRISFFKDHTGYDNSQTHINAIHSKRFAQISILKIHLEKWLILKNLMSIGEGVTFNSNIVDVRDLTGNYVLKTSIVHFIRAKRDWECGATVHLIRTNRVR